MLSDEFRRITDVFPDAALLLARNGSILAANRGVASIGLDYSRVPGSHLSEWVATPAEALLEYLRLCSRSSEPVLGALDLRDQLGRMIACRAYGVAIPGRDPLQGDVQVLLRLALRESTPTRFAILNQKIEQLTDEIRSRRKVEQELREQEQWLRVTLASIGDAVITTNEQGQVTFLNSVAEVLTGWSTADAHLLPLDTVFRIVNEETRQKVENPVDKVLREGTIVGLGNHTVLISRDGTERPIDDSAAPIRDDQGQIGGVVLVFRDNSAQHRAAEELRQNRLLLLSVLDNTPAAIYLKDRSGKILLANRHFCQLIGQSPDKVLGRVDADLFGPRFDESIRENDRRVFETAQPMEFVERLQLADGTRTYLSLKALVDEVGYAEPVLVGIATDVTEREQAKEEIGRLLAREQQQTRNLMQLASASLKIHSALTAEDVLTITTSEAQRIIGAHHAASSLLATPDVPRVSARSLTDHYAEWRGGASDERPESEALYRLVCGGNRAVRLTRDEMLQNPQWRSFAEGDAKHPPLEGWLAAPFVHRNGDNMGLIQLSHKTHGEFSDDDLSILQQLASVASVALENARLYQELRDADRRKDEFLAMLAHELRNPLAPIRNALVLLGMDALDAETTTQAHEIIDRQVDHLVRLVDDLLDVSRIMRGKIELRFEPTEVRTILDRAVETVRPLVDQQQHTLTISAPAEPLWVQADLVRMAQVISNLLNNAAKYTEPGGQIWLSARKVDAGIEIHVRDSGVGIEPALLPHLFDLFTQAGRSVERSQGGLGIGLTLVRSLVEMHGGQVEARSAGLGQGSEFIVSIPAVATEIPPAPTVQQVQRASRPLRVLVVEDIVGSAKMMATMLNKFWKHEVRIAHDGPEALQVARQFEPELVLLDIGLPQLDGYEVARRLRAEPKTASTMLVALTGYGTQEDRRRSREAGFDEHLVKPASVDNLQRIFAHPRLNGAPPTA